MYACAYKCAHDFMLKLFKNPMMRGYQQPRTPRRFQDSGIVHGAHGCFGGPQSTCWDPCMFKTRVTPGRVWDPWRISCVGDCWCDGAHPYTCLRAGSDGKRGRLYSRGEGDATRSELRSIERFTRKPVFGPGRYSNQETPPKEYPDPLPG